MYRILRCCALLASACGRGVKGSAGCAGTDKATAPSRARSLSLCLQMYARVHAHTGDGHKCCHSHAIIIIIIAPT